MKKLLVVAGLTSLAFASFGSASAIADPTTGGTEAARRVTVTVPTTPVRRMSAKYSTDTFTCTTTESVMLNRIINQPARGAVTVHFETEVFPGCRALISLRRNGVLVPGPGDAASPMAMHDTAGDLSTNGFVWAVPGVPAGVNQNFAVTCTCISGETTTVDERSLVIYHQ